MGSADQQSANTRPQTIYQDDTIDLGALLRGLFGQWKLIATITGASVILAVITVLVLPNKYKVEAIISEPAPRDVKPLLAQAVETITPKDITRAFLINIGSFSLVRSAYEAVDMGESTSDVVQSEQSKVSTIRGIQNSLTIEPVELTFLGEDTQQSLENVSLSLMSADPLAAKRLIDQLLILAENKTLSDLKRDIEAERDIRIAQIQSQINSIELAALSELENRQLELEQALSIAESLNIESPTSWEALIHGPGNVQNIYLREQSNDLFLQGTRFLTAQIEGLRRDGATRLFENNINDSEVIIPELPDRLPEEWVSITPILKNQTIGPTELRGELAALQNIQIDLTDVSLINDDSLASIPANPESPKRQLIVSAAFVLGFFLGFLVALIQLALRNDNNQ